VRCRLAVVTETGLIRYKLVQARRHDDPAREEERMAFAARLRIDASRIEPFNALLKKATFDAVTDGVDAVLVGGSGEFSVYDDQDWLPPFFDTLGELATQQFPTFASCFGFQGLVMALGGNVALDSTHAEVGTYELERLREADDDPLFGHLPDRFLAQCGHKDRAYTLPESATNLLRSQRCPYQAIRIGEVVYATQFHPELTGPENRDRFARYITLYANVFGGARAQEMLESFIDSPSTTDLLFRFSQLVES
jgi:GMP synthase (glutamine-hydrolysing)